MKIRIQSKSFREAFAAAGAFVPARSAHPIYRSVKLSVAADSAVLVAHDPESGVAIRRPLDGVACDEPGDVLLPPPVITRLMSAVGEETVTLSLAGDKLTIKTRSAKVEASTADPEKFADPAFDAAGKVLAVSAPDLRTAIRRTTWACDEKSTKYALGGPCFRWTADRLTLTATDARRVAEATIPAESRDPESEWKVVVPASSLKLIDATFRGEGVVRVAVGPHEAVFADDSGAVVSARLLHGRFPNIDAMRHDGNISTSAPIDPATFVPVLRQAVSVDDGSSSAGTLHTSPDSLAIRGVSGAAGAAEADYPVAWSGDPAEMTVNLSFLDQAIKAAGDDPFTLAFATSSRFEGRSPDLAIESPGFYCTIVPMAKG